VRVVRLPDSAGVELDPTGKRAGRGAYVCVSDACLTLAFKKGGLARTLKCKVPASLEADIRAHVATLQAVSVNATDDVSA
jgi:predicted RNA-binding protein YlxR (DUF448 family)